MTTIVSRLYDTVEAAEAAAEALHAAGHDPATIATVTAEARSDNLSGETSGQRHGPFPVCEGAIRARICAAGVGSVSAAVYAGEVARGRGLLVVRAPFTPFGRAREAMRIAARFAPVAVPGVNPDQHVRDYPDPAHFNTVLRDHPRWFAGDIPPLGPRRRGLVSVAFGLPVLWRRRPRGALRDGQPLTRMLGLPTVAHWGGRSALPGGGLVSRWFWPLPLLTRRPG